MKTNRSVIVQCRLSSTRLPGKGLMDLCGKPVLAYVLEAMHKVKADHYFVATDQASYEQLLPVCREYGFECFAGSLDDVLDRFVSLLDTIKTKTVIRATADNPFLFYEAAEESVQLFEEKNSGKEHCDYLTYSGLPHGSGVEIFSADSLKKAAKETSDPYDHEHVGPALYNHKDRYTCEFIDAPRRYAYPELRTTIDTYSDFLRAVSILNYFKAHNYEGPYTTEQILEAAGANSVKYPVVLVPSVIKGHGTGHLRRCLNTAKDGRFFVYIPEDKTLKETDSIVEEYLADGLSKNQIINTIPDDSYLPAIITDTFELTENQLKELSKNRSLISIDEGSAYTDYCDYLLDIIPSYKIERRANLTDSGFITMPENVRSDALSDALTDEKEIKNVLICLGGEDPSNLTMPAAQAFRRKFPDAKITAIISHADNPYVDLAGGPNIEFIKPIPGLREKLYEYDIVVTHYGLTAFEAVYAGCGVILLPTTKLHKKLAQKYNFAYVDDKKISDNSLQNALYSENLYAKKILSGEKKSLGEFLRHLSAGKRMCCPVCGKSPSHPDQVISRNETRTYRRCASCGMVYMAFTTIEDKKYQKSYFFEEYKKQYGKTYEEDFNSIKAQGMRRAAIIKALIRSSGEKTLLDIGCAYGPFLAAASDSSFNPFGTDISEDAVSYVQQKLKYPAVCSVFPEIDTAEEFGIAQFDVVTMWYVIEHFKDLGKVLRKVSKLVRKGGVFAFSTPSGEGISAVSDIDHFYEISPSDHYTIWEPSKADSILRVFGFKVERIVSTGHHPERFPYIKKTGAEKGSLRWNLIDAMSHAKGLGDTVEIYCRKI